MDLSTALSVGILAYLIAYPIITAMCTPHKETIKAVQITKNGIPVRSDSNFNKLGIYDANDIPEITKELEKTLEKHDKIEIHIVSLEIFK